MYSEITVTIRLALAVPETCQLPRAAPLCAVVVSLRLESGLLRGFWCVIDRLPLPQQVFQRHANMLKMYAERETPSVRSYQLIACTLATAQPSKRPLHPVSSRASPPTSHDKALRCSSLQQQGMTMVYLQ